MNANESSGRPTHPDGRVITSLPDQTALRRAGLFVLVTVSLSLAVYVPVVASARGWIGVEVPSGLSVLGVLSPAIAAVVLHVLAEGRAGVRSAFRPLAVRRFGRRWWLVTLALAPLVVGVWYATYLLLGGTYQQPPALDALRGPLGLAVLPVALLGALVLAAGEELGWRGYLLPLLQTRFGAAGASLVLGACWFCWHLPLRYIPGDANGGFPLGVWAVSIVATAFVYTWLFENTGGSVLAVTVFHGLLNTAGQFVALHPSVTGDPLSAFAIAGVNLAFAVVIVAVYGTVSFTRDRTVGRGAGLGSTDEGY